MSKNTAMIKTNAMHKNNAINKTMQQTSRNNAAKRCNQQDRCIKTKYILLKKLFVAGTLPMLANATTLLIWKILQ